MTRNMALCLLIVGFGLNISAFAQPVLDPNFGTSGTLYYSAFAGARDVVVQPDNKIVMVGGCSTGVGGGSYCALRLNSFGTIEGGFGNFGYGFRFFYPPGGGNVTAVAVQADGKLVLVGFGSRIVMLRLNKDGTLDTSFGTAGVVNTEVGATSNSGAKEVAIQPDGKIVVVGSSEGSGGRQFVARYLENGTLDSSFGTGGFAWTMIAGSSTTGEYIALQPDGKILASGNVRTAGSPTGSGSYLVTRLNSDGTPDAAWDGDGVLTIPYTGTSFNEGFVSMARQTDGRILALGDGNILYRLNPDGSLDTGFSGDGSLQALSGTCDPYEVVLSGGGTITVVGTQSIPPAPSSTNHNFRIARYLANGTTQGTLEIDLGGNEAAFAATRDVSGRVIVVGTRSLGTALNPFEYGTYAVACLAAPPYRNTRL